MTKMLVAVTNVKHDGEFYEAGTALDPKTFPKSALQALYDNGAVAVVEVPEPPAVTEPEQEISEDENPE